MQSSQLNQIAALFKTQFGNKVNITYDDTNLILTEPKLSPSEQAAFDAMDEPEYMCWISPYGISYLRDMSWWTNLSIPLGLTIELRDWSVDYTDSSIEGDLWFVNWLKSRCSVIDKCRYYQPMCC
jgi:hypothetical protein